MSDQFYVSDALSHEVQADSAMDYQHSHVSEQTIVLPVYEVIEIFVEDDIVVSALSEADADVQSEQIEAHTPCEMLLEEAHV